jgi:CHAD domain-containing protein
VVVELRDDRHTTGAAKRTLAAFAAVLRAEQRRSRQEGDPLRALAGSTGDLARVAAGFRKALPRDVSAKDLKEGLRLVYRKARRALEQARDAGQDDAAFHRWRKRTKALNYALELVASDGGRRVRKVHERFAALAEAQGGVTDLMVVRERFRSWAGARGEPAAALVLAELRGRINDARRSVEREGKRAFARSPRAFAARVL